MRWLCLILLYSGCQDIIIPANGEQIAYPQSGTSQGNQDEFYNATAEPDSKDFPYFAILSHLLGRDVTVSWGIGEENIRFKLLIPINGGVTCVGFGFSPRGDDRDADIAFITWSEEDGFEFTDTFTDTAGILHKDEHPDYILEHFQIHTGDDEDLLEVRLTRDIHTIDPEDYKIEWGTTRTFIIVANKCPEDEKKLDFINNSMNFIERPLSLLKSRRQLPPITPENSFSRDLVVGNITLPDDATIYWCHTLHLNLPEKVHGIKYEAILTETEIPVHHIVMFHCEIPPGSNLDLYSGPCDGKPSLLNICTKLVAAWGMGAGPFVYPSEAGVPLGGPDKSPYFLLQPHYYNPEKLSGVLDNSGIRYYFSTSLRPFDSGVLFFGVTNTENLVVPTGEPHFKWSGLCGSGCTAEGFPPSGIHVFASELHTHLTGREILTRHYRGDQELPLIDRDPHYNSTFQETRLLPHDITVLPGDSLVITCDYDTTDRTSVTTNGYGMMDEMCLNFLHYYPETQLQVCSSSISNEAIKWFFEETLGSTYENPTFSSVDWTETNQQLWRVLAHSGPINQDCLRSHREPFPGNWTNMVFQRPDNRLWMPESGALPLLM